MPSLNFPPNCDESTRYLAAKSMLRRRVLSGELGHGQQLQPELDLCRDINLSRTTVRKAIADLVSEGLLERFAGRGTFVNIKRTPAQLHLLAFLVCRHSPNVAGAYELLFRGAEIAAAEAGYHLLLVNSQNDQTAAFEQVIRLNELRVAGTLLVPLQTASPEQSTANVVAALKGANQRVVIVDEFSSDDKTPSVCSQNLEAMDELVSHVISKGFRRIAFLTSEKTEVVREREAGFRRAMERQGLAIPPEYFLQVAGLDPSRQGEQEVDVFMAMRERPEAIVCLHDLIAMNAIRRATERGLRVPQDLAVVGFDDLPASAVCQPPLTTVHQPLQDMGRRAVELLIRQLEGETIVAHHERLKCQLIERQSCAYLPAH